METRWRTTAGHQSAVYKAAKGNDQKSLEILRDLCKKEMVSPINNRGDTILHFISIHNNLSALRLLVEERSLSSEDLKIKNNNGDTPLHEAARFGRKDIVEMMINMETDIVLERNNVGETPLYVAAASGEKEVFTFLAERNFSEFTVKRDDGSTVLHAAVTEECFYFALHLLNLFPELASKRDGKGLTALNILATKHLSFRTGSSYLFTNIGTAPIVPKQMIDAIIYLCIPAMYEESRPSSTNSLEDPQNTAAHVLFKRERSSFINLLLGIAWLGEINDAKQKHILALKLARRLIENEDWSYYAHSSTTNPLIQAAKLGINELVVEIIEKYPEAADTLDEHGKNILHIAAERKNRFLFDYFLKNVAHKDRMLADIDQQGRNVMHFAASVGSPYQISPGVLEGGREQEPRELEGGSEQEPRELEWGIKAVLLMMWGALWFKRVKYCVRPRLWSLKNSQGLTAEELFERNHRGVRKEAEKTIRDLANSTLIVSTLLCTVNFAAVFTVPGGFDDKTGLPILLNNDTRWELWMMMFFLGMALFSSLYTVCTLLSALLSKFDSDDFYLAMPVKFCVACTSVYYAAVFTVLACVQAMNLENILMNKDVGWLLFLMLAAAFIVTLSFVDLSYIFFDYMYHVLIYSLSYKRQYV